jgi:hypothetical protein
MCDHVTFYLEAKPKLFYKLRKRRERTDFSLGKMGL